MPEIHASIVEQVPQLRRGVVWCTTCGHSERVDSGKALRTGWPKHCGYTMTIDSPQERHRLAARYDANQRAAQRLTCPKCGTVYDVTNAPKDWVCARCPK